MLLKYLHRNVNNVWAMKWALTKAHAVNTAFPACISVICTLNHVADLWADKLRAQNPLVVRCPTVPRALDAGSILVGNPDHVACFLSSSPHLIAMVFLDHVLEPRGYDPARQFWQAPACDTKVGTSRTPLAFAPSPMTPQSVPQRSAVRLHVFMHPPTMHLTHHAPRPQAAP